MRHNTINNKYKIGVDTNQGGSTELDEGRCLMAKWKRRAGTLQRAGNGT